MTPLAAALALALAAPVAPSFPCERAATPDERRQAIPTPSW
jgi:uncharacterized protein